MSCILQSLHKKPGWSVNAAHIYKESKKAYVRTTFGEQLADLAILTTQHTCSACKEAKHKTRMKLHLHACKRASSRIFSPTWICKTTIHLSCFETMALPLNRHAFITTRMQILQIKMFWKKLIFCMQHLALNDDTFKYLNRLLSHYNQMMKSPSQKRKSLSSSSTFPPTKRQDLMKNALSSLSQGLFFNTAQ